MDNIKFLGIDRITIAGRTVSVEVWIIDGEMQMVPLGCWREYVRDAAISIPSPDV